MTWLTGVAVLAALGAGVVGWWAWRGRLDRPAPATALRAAGAVGLLAASALFFRADTVFVVLLYLLIFGGWTLALVLRWRARQERRSLIASATAAGMSRRDARRAYRPTPAPFLVVLAWWSGSTLIGAFTLVLLMVVVRAPATIADAPQWTGAYEGVTYFTGPWWLWLMAATSAVGLVHAFVNDLRRPLALRRVRAER